MYKFIKTRHDILIQCSVNYMEMNKTLLQNRYTSHYKDFAKSWFFRFLHVLYFVYERVLQRHLLNETGIKIVSRRVNRWCVLLQMSVGLTDLPRVSEVASRVSAPEVRFGKPLKNHASGHPDILVKHLWKYQFQANDFHISVSAMKHILLSKCVL